VRRRLPWRLSLVASAPERVFFDVVGELDVVVERIEHMQAAAGPNIRFVCLPLSFLGTFSSPNTEV
jgi:hypothetical protein